MQISKLWQSLSDDERRFWRLLLDGMQYDVEDPYLVQNEFHAYLLQQPLEDVSWLYDFRAVQRLRAWYPNSASWVDRYISENAGSSVRQAVALNEALFAITGLVGGDIFGLVPVER